MKCRHVLTGHLCFFAQKMLPSLLPVVAAPQALAGAGLTFPVCCYLFWDPEAELREESKNSLTGILTEM